MTEALVLWFLAAAGFALVLGHSRITVGFRRWLAPPDTATPGALSGSRVLCELIECPMCLGVWEGGIAAATGLVHVPFGFWLSVAVLAFSTSIVNYVLARLAGAFD